MSSIFTGQPGVTLVAKTFDLVSISLDCKRVFFAIFAMSGSNVGIIFSRASIIVTSQPNAV